MDTAMAWRLSPSQFRELPDADQDEMTAYVRDICGHCGNLTSVCSDPTRPVYPQRTMCYVTAVREKTLRRVQKKYGDAEGLELHPTDGMSVWASPENFTPDDNFDAVG